MRRKKGRYRTKGRRKKRKKKYKDIHDGDEIMTEKNRSLITIETIFFLRSNIFHRSEWNRLVLFIISRFFYTRVLTRTNVFLFFIHICIFVLLLFVSLYYIIQFSFIIAWNRIYTTFIRYDSLFPLSFYYIYIYTLFLSFSNTIYNKFCLIWK